MSPQPLPSSVRPLEKDRILVVEDNIANLRVISEVLGHHYELSIATSGERALAQLKSFVPDLIILDIMMPTMGGYETCQIIKADPGTREIPIIFMTALADVQNKVHGLSLGAVDYITKPFQAEEVLARVHTHITHQKTKRQLQISEQKLKTSEKRLNDILSSLKEVVWSAFLDPFEFTFFNVAVESVFGFPAEVFLQNPNLWLGMIHGDDRDLICHKLMCLQPTIEHQTLEYRIVKSDQEVRWISCQYKTYLHEETERLCLDGIVQDITERKRAELKLLFQAQHDNLTKLANRSYFMKRLEARLLSPRAHEGELFGLIFIDLDGFKSINDNLGHYIGDQLLIAVSERLRQSVRSIDLVARLGGDEFTILIQHSISSDQIIKTCDRIKAQFEHPFMLEGQPISITASIGITVNNRPYQSADEMMRDADFAMYQAKDLGKDRFQLFEPKTQKKVLIEAVI